VLALFDVATTRQHAHELRAASDFGDSVVDMVQVPFVTLDQDLKYNRSTRVLARPSASSTARSRDGRPGNSRWDLGRSQLRDRLVAVRRRTRRSTASESSGRAAG